MGGCRTKPFRNRRCTLAEVGAREAEHDDIAPIGQRATEAVAVFGPHPYNGSSELVGGLCDSLPWMRERPPTLGGLLSFVRSERLGVACGRARFAGNAGPSRTRIGVLLAASRRPPAQAIEPQARRHPRVSCASQEAPRRAGDSVC